MSIIRLTYGTAGVVQKDYHVYIQEADADGFQATVTTFVGTSNNTNLGTLKNAMQEIGELRKDSIDMSLDDGDTVEGNIVGEIAMNKQGGFTAELINTTASNVSTLESLDRKSCTILMVEKDTHKIGSNTVKTAILINNVVVKYTEKITGGDIARSTITVSKKTPSAGAYRYLADVVQS